VEECAAGHLLAAEHGKVGERYLLGAENLTLKGLLDLLAKITGLRAPAMKIPHGVALGVAYVESAFSRLVGKEPQIPVEGVKIARHKMFVDARRPARVGVSAWVSGGSTGAGVGGTGQWICYGRAGRKRSSWQREEEVNEVNG